MRNRFVLLTVIALFAAGSLGAAWAGASANYALQPQVVAPGGAAASSASYAITSTVGQPAIGAAASASYSLCSGFWCGLESAIQKLLFLPLVRR